MRIAKIDSESIGSLIEIEKIVFPDTFNVKMGNYFLKMFFNAFTILSGYRALVAFIDEKPVGFLLAYPYKDRAALNNYLTKIFVKALVRNPLLLFKKDVLGKIISNIKSLLPGKKRDDKKKTFEIDYEKTYYMFLIAVTPDGRGHNLSRKLMLEMQALAEKDGYKHFLGSVAANNDRALHIWEAIGYIIYDIPGDSDIKYVFKDTTK